MICRKWWRWLCLFKKWSVCCFRLSRVHRIHFVHFHPFRSSKPGSVRFHRWPSSVVPWTFCYAVWPRWPFLFETACPMIGLRNILAMAWAWLMRQCHSGLCPCPGGWSTDGDCFCFLRICQSLTIYWCKGISVLPQTVKSKQVSMKISTLG